MRTIFLLLLVAFLFHNCSDDPRCNDGVLNGSETSIDCGGQCDPCYSCTDGILNQGEFDIDCGGPCPSCDQLSSWEALDLPGENPIQLHFFDKQEGVLLTDHQVWRTQNHGDSWTTINIPSSIGYFYWMKVITDNLAFALVIESGEANYRLYKITNRFNNWEEFGLNLPTTDPNFRGIFDIDAKDENNILVSHEYDHGRVYLSRTTDGGNQWEVLLDSHDLFPFNLDYIASLQYHLTDTIYAFHERDQFISLDNGLTWSVRELPFDINVNYSIDNRIYNANIQYSDNNHAIFNGANFNSIWQTNDTGTTWNRINTTDLDLTDWLPVSYLKLTDDRTLTFTTLTCLQQQIGYCSIAWLSDSNGQNWERLGLTPSLGSAPWDGVIPRTPFYFDDVIYAFDPFNGLLLRSK